MTGRDDLELSADLRAVEDRLRAQRASAEPLELDGLKRRAMAQAARPEERRRLGRGGVITSLLVVGVLAGSGTAGVIAARKPTTTKPSSAVSSQYKCNSGIGNGSEQPPTPPSPDCDPGNSPSHNATNPCEGPPTIQPPTCKPTPQKPKK